MRIVIFLFLVFCFSFSKATSIVFMGFDIVYSDSVFFKDGKLSSVIKINNFGDIHSIQTFDKNGIVTFSYSRDNYLGDKKFKINYFVENDHLVSFTYKIDSNGIYPSYQFPMYDSNNIQKGFTRGDMTENPDLYNDNINKVTEYKYSNSPETLILNDSTFIISYGDSNSRKEDFIYVNDRLVKMNVIWNPNYHFGSYKKNSTENFTIVKDTRFRLKNYSKKFIYNENKLAGILSLDDKDSLIHRVSFQFDSNNLLNYINNLNYKIKYWIKSDFGYSYPVSSIDTFNVKLSYDSLFHIGDLDIQNNYQNNYQIKIRNYGIETSFNQDLFDYIICKRSNYFEMNFTSNNLILKYDSYHKQRSFNFFSFGEGIVLEPRIFIYNKNWQIEYFNVSSEMDEYYQFDYDNKGRLRFENITSGDLKLFYEYFYNDSGELYRTDYYSTHQYIYKREGRSKWEKEYYTYSDFDKSDITFSTCLLYKRTYEIEGNDKTIWYFYNEKEKLTKTKIYYKIHYQTDKEIDWERFE